MTIFKVHYTLASDLAARTAEVTAKTSAAASAQVRADATARNDIAYVQKVKVLRNA